MKTIALLGIAAGLVLAGDGSQDKNQDKNKGRDQKASPAKKPAFTQAAEPLRGSRHRYSAAQTAAPKLTPEQKKAAQLPTVPAGATQVGPNLYRYTDPQGKTWMYRKTPFGVSKWEDQPVEQPPVPETPASITAKDLGDSVQFERATPFGPERWVRKKSELSDLEKAALAKQQAAPATGPGKATAKAPEKP